MTEHSPQTPAGINVATIYCDGAVCIDDNGKSYVAVAGPAAKPEQRTCIAPHFYTTIAPSMTDARWWRERRYCPGPKTHLR